MAVIGTENMWFEYPLQSSRLCIVRSRAGDAALQEPQ
jgi:hypothetical protein